MSDVSPSKLDRHMTPEMIEAVNACTSAEEITALLHAAETEVGLRRPDALNPSLLLEVTEPVPQRYAKVLNINGIKHTVEADTEQGLGEAELAVMRQIFGGHEAGQHEEPQPEQKLELVYDPLAKAYRDSSGRFVSDQVARNIIEKHEQESRDDYRQTALEHDIKTKLLRGEISLTEAMDQSGVVDRALARQEQQSWATSVTAALAEGGPLEDWPGSPDGQLLEALGNKLAELHLENAPDKVSALAQAWNAMKAEAEQQTDADAQAAYEKELAACTSRAEIDQVTAKYFAGRTMHGQLPDTLASSGSWGR